MLEACFRVVRPSVRPKPEIPSFHMYMGPNRDRFASCQSLRPSICPSVCPSVRPEKFPGICQRTHGENNLKFCMLMYLNHRQNWLVYGHGPLNFQILALFWLSEMGQICFFPIFWGKLHNCKINQYQECRCCICQPAGVCVYGCNWVFPGV